VRTKEGMTRPGAGGEEADGLTTENGVAAGRRLRRPAGMACRNRPIVMPAAGDDRGQQSKKKKAGVGKRLWTRLARFQRHQRTSDLTHIGIKDKTRVNVHRANGCGAAKEGRRHRKQTGASRNASLGASSSFGLFTSRQWFAFLGYLWCGA